MLAFQRDERSKLNSHQPSSHRPSRYGRQSCCSGFRTNFRRNPAATRRIAAHPPQLMPPPKCPTCATCSGLRSTTTPRKISTRSSRRALAQWRHQGPDRHRRRGCLCPKDTPSISTRPRDHQRLYRRQHFSHAANALSTGASSCSLTWTAPPWSPNSSSTPAARSVPATCIAPSSATGSTHLQCRRSLARSDGRRSAKSRRVSDLQAQLKLQDEPRRRSKTPLRARRAEHRHQRSQRHNAQCAGDRRREAAQEPRTELIEDFMIAANAWSRASCSKCLLSAAS